MSRTIILRASKLQKDYSCLEVPSGHRLSGMDKKTFSARQVAAILVEHQGKKKNADFADEIGVTPQCLRDIYRGHSNPGPKILKYLRLKRVMKRVVRYEQI